MTNSDTNLVISHLNDLARACSYAGDARFSRFLEPSYEKAAYHAAKQNRISVILFGGYEKAERRVACFHTSEEMDSVYVRWPMRCLRLSWNAKYGSCTHRDLLGAVMGHGLERACLGDIAMGEGCAFLFATPEAANYLIGNLNEAGRVKLNVMEVEISDVQLAAPVGKQVRVTLASLRLDVVLAEGFNLPRHQAQNLIGRGMVKVNHLVVEKSESRMVEGDLISCRGHGRLRVENDLGETKKGRRALRLFLYDN